LERQPDLQLIELRELLQDAFDFRVSTATISRTLERRGFTSKKISRTAVERDEDDRAAYKLLIGEHFRPDQLVFIDESHVN
ncbi:hypothetical protein BDN72DRAFT_746879, partial [Pluteus cervinus]